MLIVQQHLVMLDFTWPNYETSDDAIHGTPRVAGRRTRRRLVRYVDLITAAWCIAASSENVYWTGAFVSQIKAQIDRFSLRVFVFIHEEVPLKLRKCVA